MGEGPPPSFKLPFKRVVSNFTFFFSFFFTLLQNCKLVRGVTLAPDFDWQTVKPYAILITSSTQEITRSTIEGSILIVICRLASHLRRTISFQSDFHFVICQVLWLPHGRDSSWRRPIWPFTVFWTSCREVNTSRHHVSYILNYLPSSQGHSHWLCKMRTTLLKELCGMMWRSNMCGNVCVRICRSVQQTTQKEGKRINKEWTCSKL